MKNELEANAPFSRAVEALRGQILARIESLVHEMTTRDPSDQARKLIDDEIAVNRKLVDLLSALEKSTGGQSIGSDRLADLDFAKARSEILARLQKLARI